MIPAEITVVDFETTGSVPGWPNEPWQIGLARLGPSGIVPGSQFSAFFRIDPSRPFSPRAPGRWAAMRGELAAAPSPLELWGEISPRLSGTPLAAHNVSTERTVLRRLAPLTSFGPWVDSLSETRKRFPGFGSYALGDLIAEFGLGSAVEAAAPGGTWHDALYDACASAVLLAFLRTVPDPAPLLV